MSKLGRQLSDSLWFNVWCNWEAATDGKCEWMTIRQAYNQLVVQLNRRGTPEVKWSLHEEHGVRDAWTTAKLI